MGKVAPPLTLGGAMGRPPCTGATIDMLIMAHQGHGYGLGDPALCGSGRARATDMIPTATLMAAEPPGGGVRVRGSGRWTPTHTPTLWLFARACSLTTF